MEKDIDKYIKTVNMMVRSKYIIKSICPVCKKQYNYPNQAGECCDE